MMSPQDVIQGQRQTTVRNVAASPATAAGGKYNRDDRRRNTHNEVLNNLRLPVTMILFLIIIFCIVLGHDVQLVGTCLEINLWLFSKK